MPGDFFSRTTGENTKGIPGKFINKFLRTFFYEDAYENNAWTNSGKKPDEISE